ncbi:hypothetical protein HOP50_02g17130 [Chloropicon primus]|uniref:Uncharacterized protein n=1 Tax=Chloropicon primus TaxID=1764295 RepID=A0A5B8MFM3_9CHLO|nr:hypothetical protein A3770_02p17170 [Chloropicon primus]UPQ98407.1 hypothetical protein HOP50_02g17130 [Chloropicon primus]|eukprot:QDZ19199.1 hypothetical protein A3770_02p17170 [Chloropicon primus]
MKSSSGGLRRPGSRGLRRGDRFKAVRAERKDGRIRNIEGVEERLTALLGRRPLLGALVTLAGYGTARNAEATPTVEDMLARSRANKLKNDAERYAKGESNFLRAQFREDTRTEEQLEALMERMKPKQEEEEAIVAEVGAAPREVSVSEEGGDAEAVAPSEPGASVEEAALPEIPEVSEIPVQTPAGTMDDVVSAESPVVPAEAEVVQEQTSEEPKPAEPQPRVESLGGVAVAPDSGGFFDNQDAIVDGTVAVGGLSILWGGASFLRTLLQRSEEEKMRQKARERHQQWQEEEKKKKQVGDALAEQAAAAESDKERALEEQKLSMEEESGETLAKALAEKEKELELEYTKNLETALEKQKDELEGGKAELSATLKAELEQRLRADLEKEQSKLMQDFDAKLEFALREQKAQLGKEHQQNLAETNASLEKEMKTQAQSELQSALDAQMVSLKADFAKELERALAEQKISLSESTSTELSEMLEKQKESLEAFASEEMEKALAELTQQLAAEKENALSALQERLERHSREELEKALESNSAQSDAALLSAKADHTKELAVLREKHANEVEQLREEVLQAKTEKEAIEGSITDEALHQQRASLQSVTEQERKALEYQYNLNEPTKEQRVSPLALFIKSVFGFFARVFKNIQLNFKRALKAELSRTRAARKLFTRMIGPKS